MIVNKTKLCNVISRMSCVGYSIPLQEFYSFVQVLPGEIYQPPRKRLCSNNRDAVPKVVEDDVSFRLSEDGTI